MDPTPDVDSTDVFAPWAPPGTRLAGPGNKAFHTLRSADHRGLDPSLARVFDDGSLLLAAPTRRADLGHASHGALLYSWPLLSDGDAPRPGADPRLEAYWTAHEKAYHAGRAPFHWWEDRLDRMPDGLVDRIRALGALDIAAAGLLARGVVPGRLRLTLLGATAPWPSAEGMVPRHTARFRFSHQGVLAPDPNADPALVWLRGLEKGLGKHLLPATEPLWGQRWSPDQDGGGWSPRPTSLFSLEAYVQPSASVTAHQAMAYAAQAAALMEDV